MLSVFELWLGNKQAGVANEATAQKLGQEQMGEAPAVKTRKKNKREIK
jgi:hypothetical protein